MLNSLEMRKRILDLVDHVDEYDETLEGSHQNLREILILEKAEQMKASSRNLRETKANSRNLREM